MVQRKIDEEKKHGVGEGMVPRQFLDLGPSTAEVEDHVSNSSSDERTRSSTPHNNNGKSEIGREGSPDSESQGWGPNKLQKLNPTNAIEQSNAEATMRKARVSVRARSEAPMVSDCVLRSTSKFIKKETSYNFKVINLSK